MVGVRTRITGARTPGDDCAIRLQRETMKAAGRNCHGICALAECAGVSVDITGPARVIQIRIPAINRWAIFKRSCGTKSAMLALWDKTLSV